MLTSIALSGLALPPAGAQTESGPYPLIGADAAKIQSTLGTGRELLGTLFNEEKSFLHAGQLGGTDPYRIRIGYFRGKCCYAMFEKKRGSKIRPPEALGLLYLCSSKAKWTALTPPEDPSLRQFLYQPVDDKGLIVGTTLQGVLHETESKLVVYSPEWRPIFDTDIDIDRANEEVVAFADGAGPQLEPQAQNAALPDLIAPRDPLVQLDAAPARKMREVSKLIRATQAREQFGVDGKGLIAAVLDTGLRSTHIDFINRVAGQRNFTDDNGGNPEDARDGDGHGTHCAGIIMASGTTTGVAPGAAVMALKVLRNDGRGSFTAVKQALKWILENQTHGERRIGVVNLSLGDGANHLSEPGGSRDELRELITRLREQGIPVVIAAGNDFHVWSSAQGMNYPGIIRECISVGAVYDAHEPGPFDYKGRGFARSGSPDQITPFSQRYHPSVAGLLMTDIFAPGAPVTSTGIKNDEGVSIQSGTSQATPVTCGVILLLQEYYLRATGKMPGVAQLEGWMRASATPIQDNHGDLDNVRNTGLEFLRVDAEAALMAAQNSLEQEALRASRTE